MFSLMETLDCPNCAAEVVVDGRYAHVAVCASCRSVITYGQDAAKVRGELSLLPTGSTPLYVDARGRVKGERFVVLGRVRYGYGSGYWDEWYLELEDGGIGWLVEDEGRLSYERSVPNPEVSFDALELGGEVALGGTPFRVKEKNVAHCAGGEGQLPFLVLQGEETPYADLEGGSKRRATLEYGAEGMRTFRGLEIAYEALELDATRQELGLDESIPVAAKTVTGRKIVTVLSGPVRAVNCHGCGGAMEVDIRDGVPERVRCPYCGVIEQLASKSWACPSCGQEGEVRSGDEAAMVTCTACHAAVDLRPRAEGSAAPRVLHILAQGSLEHRPQIPLGAHFVWKATTYELIGWLRNAASDFHWDEYLFFHPTRGFLWLELSDGHATVGRRIDDGPQGTASDFKIGVTYRRRFFRTTEREQGKVVWAEGELPWIAQVGDTFTYLDAVRPPYRLGGEWTTHESEWFLGEYVSRAELLRGLREGRSQGGWSGAWFLQALDMESVPGHRPYPRWKKQSWWVMLAALIYTFAVADIAQSQVDRSHAQVISQFPASALATGSKQPIEMKPMQVKPDQVYGLGVSATGLKHGWLYLWGELKAADGTATKFSVQLMDIYIKGGLDRDVKYAWLDLKFKGAGPHTLVLNARYDRVYETRAGPAFNPRITLRLKPVKGWIDMDIFHGVRLFCFAGLFIFGWGWARFTFLGRRA